ncbi:MAG TPA: 50S ribosomal protein L11 [Thermoprotei archaeon]|nr:50S ribosomal protein L11 [Thermoprotei archaeon]
MSGNKQVVDVLISGGEATAGPPLGPKLGPLGINVKAVVDRINELTKDFRGMKVPVKIIVDVDTKEFQVEVGIPTVSALIAKEAGIEKGSSEPGRKYVGDLTFDQIVKISKMIIPKLKINNLKSVVLQVIGTCVSMGIKIDGKDPKIVTKEVKEGFYDRYFTES